MKDKKIAFFDFCETLIGFQTADAFVNYILKQTVDSHRRLKWPLCLYIFLSRIKVLNFLDKVTRHKYSINKRLVLLQLRNQKEIVLKKLAVSYYQDVIKPNIIHPMLELLKEKQKDAWKIVIVSGGYDIYIHLFAKEFNVDGIISSQIEFKNGICTGCIKGLDCLGKNKVLLLNKQYDREFISSIAYSDSITDLPLLKWVNEGWVVSKDKSQLWAKNHNLKEIIWTEKN